MKKNSNITGVHVKLRKSSRYLWTPRNKTAQHVVQKSREGGLFRMDIFRIKQIIPARIAARFYRITKNIKVQRTMFVSIMYTIRTLVLLVSLCHYSLSIFRYAIVYN